MSLRRWVRLEALPEEQAGLSARLGAARLRIAYPAGADAEGTWISLDEPAGLLPLLDWGRALDHAERPRPADEVIAASLVRAVHAPAQPREVITQFWHHHFDVHAQKNEFVSVFFPA